jgi:TetR/AcrR family transcriptional repressor of nem operon
MVQRRRHRKGGCVIGNLSTELSATHDAFRKRLAACFDEMAREYQPHLEAAVRRHRPGRPVDTRALARYVVALIEGSIMLARTHKDGRLLAHHFDYLKEHLRRECGPEAPA